MWMFNRVFDSAINNSISIKLHLLLKLYFAVDAVTSSSTAAVCTDLTLYVLLSQGGYITRRIQDKSLSSTALKSLSVTHLCLLCASEPTWGGGAACGLFPWQRSGWNVLLRQGCDFSNCWIPAERERGCNLELRHSACILWKYWIKQQACSELPISPCSRR